jgi:tetratricopeptide (TPR) repeat protein
MHKPTTAAPIAFLAAVLASCSATNQTADSGGGTDQDGLSAVAAQRLLDAGQVDEALLMTDRILRARPRDREARVVAAKGNLALFQEGRGQPQLFLDQAVRELEQALEIDRDDPTALISLSWCKLQQSEFSRGRDLALEAASLLRNADAPGERVAGALLQAADNQMQIFVEARRKELGEGEERPGSGTTGLANQVLASLTDADRAASTAGAALRRARVYSWMNRSKDALEELEVGIRTHPTDSTLHDELQRSYWDRDKHLDCVAAYRRLLKESPGNGAILWYLGKAQVALGDQLRQNSDWEGAESRYQQALTSYQEYDVKRPADRANTSQWLAICHLNLGRVAYERGDLERAASEYEAAWKASPLVAEYDEDGFPRLYITGGGNYLGGLAQIGMTLSNAVDESALRQTLAFFETVIERHPDRFGAIYNNAALAARDLGAKLEREAREAQQGGTGADAEALTAEAMQLYETSYRYYEVAVRLSPDDARVVNDCGLMLVYHLNRDYDRAQELFERAIELGEQSLAELPADAPDEERRDLEEAVGDAHDNLGKLFAENLQEPERAVPYLEKSLAYFPYQQRASRQLLERIRSGATSPEQRAEQQRRQATFETALGKASAEAEEANFDGALSALDAVAKDLRDFAPFHYHYGLFSLQMAEQQAADGGGVGLVDGLFQDAVRNLRKAVEIDKGPLEPRLALARAESAIGEFARAANAADALLLHARSTGGAAPEFLRETHKVRGEAAARAFVASKQDPEATADEEMLRQARASFREIADSPLLDDATLQLWVATEQWAEAPAQALEIMMAAWRRDPAKLPQLVELASQLGRSEEVVAALADTTDATELWYRGRAGFDLGVQHWAGGEPDDAVAALDAALASFRASAETNAEFTDSCDQWRALTLGQRGMVQISADQLEAAADSLLEAARLRPDVAGNDLGGGSTIRRGILLVGDRYFTGGDLAAAVAFYERAAAALPEDGQIQNNLGLFARDHGDALKRAGQTEAAQEFYETSYAAYSAATRLQPDDIRLRQDRALILVYCLERDFETATELLQASIDEGSELLAESPPDDATELRDLQEAVGDAYMNLGYLQMRHLEQFEAAKENFEKSLEFYPFERRASRGYLRQVETRRNG